MKSRIPTKSGANKLKQPLLPFVDNPHLITTLLIEGRTKHVILTLKFRGLETQRVIVIDNLVLDQFVVLLNPELVEFSMGYIPDDDLIASLTSAKIPWRRIG